MRNLPSKHGMGVIVYACLIPCLVEAIVDVPNGSSDGLLQAAIMNNWGTNIAEGTDALLKPRLVKRSTSNIVDIAMFEDSSAPGETFSIYVDDTMSRLIIQVDVEGSNPVMMITKPNSSPGPHPALNTTTGTRIHISTIDTAITAADFGIWKIMKMDASKWTVKVKGESPLDFSYQFLEGTMFKMPITGDPIQGKTYTTTITVPEISKIQQIDTVMVFVMEKFTPANKASPKDKGGGTFELASVKMLDQEFMIGIQGKDQSGHSFRRVVLIKPVTLSLIVPSYAGVKLYENSVIDITFYVVNELSKDQDIDVRIVDTKKFAQAPIFISAILTPGQNYTGKFTIKGGQPGETTVATITARQYLGHGNFSPGPSEVRQFTVESNDTKTTPTTTMTTATTKLTSTKSSTTSAATPESPTSNSSQVTTPASLAPYIVPSGSVSSTVQPASSVATSPKAGLVPSVANKGTTTTTEENSDSFKKGEVFTAAIASGVASGVFIGVAALVTMSLVLRKGIKAKTSVEPEKMEKKNRKFSEYDSKWAIPSKCRYSKNNLTKAND